ncbi:hypothetical protein M2101_001521 [Parabacteroides sp. PM5-20]|uniref:glycosyltransferase n=1 Tax=Parabacteroides sp. PM5-20 TaxID=2940527 RepID=UPI002474E603|nr:glycosyltransferase [Parabacteroides sp. PM5-20]MDH6534845.1 hypothetical protein [Parabacteroides sp. PM5-20]
MKRIFKSLQAFVVSFYYLILRNILISPIKTGKEIPIIINNFNRLTTMLQLIEALTDRGYNNIYIIDNKSTYPPLLAYYEKCPFTVFRLNENLGYKALWKSELKKRFCKDYYIYTDSDVVPTTYCPDDFIDYFLKELKKHPFARKIGFSLRIDNIPDTYIHKDKVIDWEGKYYQRLTPDGLYRAPIDTTFALYRPFSGLSRSRYIEAYRTAYPYQAEHLPWYMDSKQLSEEETYYINHSKQATAWTSQLQEKTEG